MATARALVVFFVLTIAVSASARERPLVKPLFTGVRSVLFVAAHPDDEVIAAPLLWRLCRTERLACRFLVLTRGEGGDCALAEGCGDLAALRSEEMDRSARLYEAALTLWDLADGAPSSWDAAAGGHEALVTRLAESMTGADVVISFDPRHGSTCHGDHRAAGELVLEAAARHPDVSLQLIETRVDVSPGPPLSIVFRPAAAAVAARRYDTGNDWNATVTVMQIHRSQFPASWVSAVASVPAAGRAIYFGSAAEVMAVADNEGCGE